MGKAITGLWVEAEEDGAGSLQAARGGLAAASQGVQEKGVQAGGPTKAEAGLRELLKGKYGHCPTSFQSQSPRWVEKPHSAQVNVSGKELQAHGKSLLIDTRFFVMSGQPL